MVVILRAIIDVYYNDKNEWRIGMNTNPIMSGLNQRAEPRSGSFNPFGVEPQSGSNSAFQAESLRDSYEPGQIYVWSEWNERSHIEIPVLKNYGDTRMYYKFTVLQTIPILKDNTFVYFRLMMPISQTGTVLHMHRRTHNIVGRVRESMIDPNSKIVDAENAQFKHFRTTR